MPQYLVSSPTLSTPDLVVRWRAWKNGVNRIAPAAPAPFERAPGQGRDYIVPEHHLVWMMLEIERLRAAIEGLVKMNGGRQ